jgi:hypothetical protein
MAMTMVEHVDLTALFDRLSRSAFRRRFRLREPELGYLHRKGLDAALKHAAEFIEQRLAPAEPANDGKQTPFRHHPVFIAQHATATCCRGCLEKWHLIQRGRPLTPEDKEYILLVLKAWLGSQASHDDTPTPVQAELDFGDPDSP